MEYKLFNTPELKMSGDGNGFLTGYASTYDWDSTGERVVKGAFTKSLPEFLASGFVAVGHNWATLPIATPVEAYEDDRGLRVVAEFHSTQEAQNARTVIRERLERQKAVRLSIGYEVQDAEHTKDGRLLKQLRLFEYSFVTVPANQMAVVTGAKQIERMTLDDHAQSVLATNQAFANRMHDLQETLVKEGRPMSQARRARLESHLAALVSLQSDIQALLHETEPKPRAPADDTATGDDPAAKAMALFVEFQRIEANLNGVFSHA